MTSMTTNNLSFSEWAVLMNLQHSEILLAMRNSLDPLDRTIARRIQEVAAGEIKP